MSGSGGRDDGSRGRPAALVCVGLAMFLAALAQTVVASIVPLIVADLGGFDRYTWPSSSYLVAATVAYPIVGRLSDIYGRRAFLIAGIALFIAGSALVGFSGSMNQVIGFRALQGLGGGAVMTCCYVSIADLFPPEDRGKFHGVLGALYALATVVGPVMGVFVAEWLSWQYSFLFIALAGLPVLLLTARRFPRPRALPRQWDLDYPGMAALALAVTAVVVALSSAEVSHAWYAPQVAGLLAFGLAMAALFVAVESRARSPIMPLGIYRNPAVAVAVVVTLLTSVGLHALVLFLPLYFQLALGVSATQAGTMLMPMLLGIVLGAIVAGQLLSRAGGPLPGPGAGRHCADGGGHVSFLHPGRRRRLCPEHAGPLQPGVSDRCGARVRRGCGHALGGCAERCGVPARGERDGGAAVQPLAGRHGGSGRNGRGDVA